MTTNVYLLSILDTLQIACCTLGVFTVFASVVMTVVWLSCAYDADKNAHDVAQAARTKPLAIRLFVAGIFLSFAAALLPSAKSLRDAYLYVEMSKVATADNARLTAVEITKRIDRLIGVLDKAVKGGGK
jgi:uncharacterized membrane protein